MIVCVNLNAAIDKTMVVDHFRLGHIHRPQSMLALAGGKGCNVARVLQTLGRDALVIGWVGGFAGQFIEAQLQRDGIRTAFVQTDGESRTCTSIIDAESGAITEVYEAGIPVQPADVEALVSTVKAHLNGAHMLILSGSLPPGAPPDIYAQLIRLAGDMPTLLDASKDALRFGLEAQPTYVKPNQSELAELLGTPLETPEAQHQAAEQVARRCHTTVILSLGKRGALLTNGVNTWEAAPPTVNAVSAVGSGDSLVAGFAAALVGESSPAEALRSGVACGTANTFMIGAGRLHAADVEALRPQVLITEIR